MKAQDVIEMGAPARNGGPGVGDAFGALLWDCFAAGVPEARFYEICEREDGHVGIADATCFFAEPPRWPSVDRWAFEQILGRVLDVGVGAGRFALPLQEGGVEVVGLDVSPGAIEVCRSRGLRSLVLGTLRDLDPGPRFDSFLLMGRNLGLLEGCEVAPLRLAEMARLARPSARIVGTGLDPSLISDPNHCGYFAHNLRRGRMAGQMRLRLRHGRLATEWFDYLFASALELEGLLAGTGWSLADVRSYGGVDYGFVLLAS